jgi:hypothetical protein
MKVNITTWALVGGVVLAVGAAMLYSGGDDTPTPTPEAAVTPQAESPAESPGAAAPAGEGIGGKVAEVIQVDSYTYVRLDNGTWAAVPRTELAVGVQVVIANASLMRDFESKTLGRTFEAIYFGTLGTEGVAGKGVAGTGALPAGHPPLDASPGGMPADHAAPGAGAPGHGAPGHGAPGAGAPAGDVAVPRAEGGVTVAELYGKAAELEGKKVTFAGRVVKVAPNILGKTWLHVQDGTGDAAAGTNDIVVTTQAVPAVGDTATLTGTLARNKDLGSGYRYDVLVEDATLSER